MNVFAQLKIKTRVIPVVSLTDAAQALPLAHALLKGGVDAIEITLRHPCALEAIARVVREKLPICVLAGTVLSPAQLEQVRDAGAVAGLSPGFDPAVVELAARYRFPFIPGVMTPSEAIMAVRAGCDSLKFFPAVQAGGIGSLNALAAVLPDVRFCPTGGIDINTAPEFLRLPNVAVVGGSWLTPKSALETADWARITELARACSTL